MPVGATVDPSTPVRFGVDPALRVRLADLSAGRPLVIDYFASRRCSVVTGDLTAEFRQGPPNGSYVMVASIEGVDVFAENRLVRVFEDAALMLRLGGPVFARHLVVSLDPGSRWIDFLEQPNVLAGRGRSDRIVEPAEPTIVRRPDEGRSGRSGNRSPSAPCP